MNACEEYLFCVDEKGNPVQPVLRKLCHGNPEHTHRVCHVFVRNSKNKILAQLRAKSKDIQPGKWDIAVGGHIDPGESVINGAKREFYEELGVLPADLHALYEYVWLSDMESELVSTFECTMEGPFHFDSNEIDKIQFFSFSELKEMDQRNEITPNFRYELNRYAKYQQDSHLGIKNYPARTLCRCEECPRLASYRKGILPKGKHVNFEYWNRPVPGFGDLFGRMLVVGLAPGAHGANRTGRPFTGDAAGEILYESLFKLKLASKSSSLHRNDGLVLKDVFITNATKCVPPDNLPSGDEMTKCSKFLKDELEILINLKVILALGHAAYKSVISILIPEKSVRKQYPFRHGAIYQLGSSKRIIAAAYHPSRRNINTGLMTKSGFLEVLTNAYDAIFQGRD